MKNLIPILLAIVVLSSGCDPDGYSCNSEGCYAENEAQYLTLEDCLSVCDEITPKPVPCGDLVSHAGHFYDTVEIGEQCWFSENCRYLPEVSPPSEGSEIEAYYYVYGYEGTDVLAAQQFADSGIYNNYEKYGVLYNWPAVMTEGICPSGWHIPSDYEWTQLTDFLGGSSAAGTAMKTTYGWEPNGNGTNSSGFRALPGGNRSTGGYFSSGNIPNKGCWWSSSNTAISEKPNEDVWTRWIEFAPYVVRSANFRSRGNSARCIRD